MTTEGQRAPGQVREHDGVSGILAEATRRNRLIRTACEGLNSFKINDHLPFSTSPEDLMIEALESADALTMMLSFAIEPDANGESSVRLIHARRALDGLQLLLGLTAFAAEAQRLAATEKSGGAR